jgi:hypothetical protein
VSKTSRTGPLPEPAVVRPLSLRLNCSINKRVVYKWFQLGMLRMVLGMPVLNMLG